MPGPEAARFFLESPCPKWFVSRNPPCVGHGLTTAGCREDPSVEWAAQSVALDLPATSEVRSEVGAMRVQECGTARTGPVEHALPAEDRERLHVSGLKLLRLRHDEPARRDRQGEARHARQAPREASFSMISREYPSGSSTIATVQSQRSRTIGSRTAFPPASRARAKRALQSSVYT